MLHKSVGHYSKSKSEYFALNTPPIFQDKVTFSVWFPEAKRKVLIPKFELSILGVVGIIMQSRYIQSTISLIPRSDLLFIGRMCEFVMQPFISRKHCF